MRSQLQGKASVADILPADRFKVRQAILLADSAIKGLVKKGGLGLTHAERDLLDTERHQLKGLTEYAPVWVKIAIALALGIGTMVGWKRIVVTVGEKIGKSHLTYAQGASAELVAMATIGMSSGLGLPVSTTHVLSSGIAGTMVAQSSGLQSSTVRNIAMAWVLTLPVSMGLSAVLFLILQGDAVLKRGAPDPGAPRTGSADPLCSRRGPDPPRRLRDGSRGPAGALPRPVGADEPGRAAEEGRRLTTASRRPVRPGVRKRVRLAAETYFANRITVPALESAQ